MYIYCHGRVYYVGACYVSRTTSSVNWKLVASKIMGMICLKNYAYSYFTVKRLEACTAECQ